MTVLAILVVMLMVWRRVTPSAGSVALAGLRRLAGHASLVRAAALALVPLYAAQLGLDVLRCRTENAVARLAWMNALPLPVHDWRAPMTAAIAAPRALSSALALGVGSLETAALALVVAGLLQQPRLLGRRFLSLLALTFALLSLVAPALSTTDPYEFVAAGMLGWAAYAPPSGAFSGTAYAAVAPHIPLVGVVYGPLWLLVDSLQTMLAGSLSAKLEALRAGNVLCVFASVILLAKNGVSRAVAAAFIINPAVWYECVANMHAESLALLAFAAVYHFARRGNARLAAICLAAAGLIKLPFVLIGGALLAPLAGRRRAGGSRRSRSSHSFRGAAGPITPISAPCRTSLMRIAPAAGRGHGW